MDLPEALLHNLGLIGFTVVTAVLILYLLYAMLNPTRF